MMPRKRISPLSNKMRDPQLDDTPKRSKSLRRTELKMKKQIRQEHKKDQKLRRQHLKEFRARETKPIRKPKSMFEIVDAIVHPTGNRISNDQPTSKIEDLPLFEESYDIVQTNEAQIDAPTGWKTWKFVQWIGGEH